MNVFENNILLAEVVFHPSWYFKHCGITFDRDFFFHPAKRVEAEQQMEKALFERFGRYGLGENHDKLLPLVGAVHNASGYLLSAMLGCDLKFFEGAPPDVIPAEQEYLAIDETAAFRTDIFKDFMRLYDKLQERFGYVCGDVNWSGILNIALDLRGQMLFMDMYDKPEELKKSFQKIAVITERFAKSLENTSGSSSISVNRLVRHLDKPVFLHSECSVTMISVEQYEEFIMPVDREWSKRARPYGIHYCGNDPHRFAASFAKLPHLDFLDVGWGGDLKLIRHHLPDTFLNIRLSPTEIVEWSPDEINRVITQLIADSGNPFLTGICCINMDDRVSDEQVSAIFETVFELRKQYSKEAGN